ncbi:hypothetical protein [Roseibium album]|uniref:hypothetical protein n=1 Tax=Roseibium album TaxID=311410 RepID=UPI002491CF38|nr:hypothetical protein [Roseibium album]
MNPFPVDKMQLHDALVALTARLEEIGDVKIRMSYDVEELERAQQNLGKKESGEHFRRSMDTLPPNRFFWLGAELDGKIIGTVAARCDDSAWPLQEFVKNYWERTYEAKGETESGAAPKVLIKPGSPAEAAEYEAGRFVYLGEALTENGLRSRNLSIVLVRLALLFSFDEWRPTVAYGWMRDWHAYHGLHVRWGFNRCDTNAFEWLRPPRETDWHDLAFLVCNQRGFQKLMKHPAPDEAFQPRKNNSKQSRNQTPGKEE